MKKIFIFILLLAVLVAAPFYVLSPRKDQVSNNLKYTRVEKSNGSWFRNYKNIDELYEGADLVVSGKVEQNLSPLKDKNGFVATGSEFKIDKVFKGNSNIGDNIIIMQDVGVIDNVLYQMDNEELLKKGKNYILYLYNGDPNDNLYSVLTGWQGQFLIEEEDAVNPEKERSLKKVDLSSNFFSQQI